MRTIYPFSFILRYLIRLSVYTGVYNRSYKRQNCGSVDPVRPILLLK